MTACTAGELNINAAKRTINPSGADVIVFRVAHSHPHRLKRPLQHSDQLTGAQFALRVYAVMEHDVEKETPTLVIQRRSTADVELVDLFGRARIQPEELMKHFLQWTVQPAIRFESGALTLYCIVLYCAHFLLPCAGLPVRGHWKLGVTDH